jgi:hypothetical protein
MTPTTLVVLTSARHELTFYWGNFSVVKRMFFYF